MHTKAEVLAALDRRLPERMNLGVVENSIVVVMNMETALSAHCGLIVVAEAVNVAIEAAGQALSEAEEALSARGAASQH